MQTTEITTTPVEVRTDFLHWSPVIAGALVASAFSLVLPLHRDFVEFRDGAHGLTAWALAVAITALIAAVIAGATTSRTAPPASMPGSNTEETLIAYDLDRLFRSNQRRQSDLTYSRAEASRILLAGTSRGGMKSEDRDYLVRLVANQTGVALAEAEQRVTEAISSATRAVKRTRQTGVIVGFSIAVSLLLGAAAAWYAARLGGEHRDQTAPPLRWDLART